MAVSNNRVKERNTVHHLISRIAHRVYFLKDEECQDFLSMMFRVAEFCGIRLLGWCIMTNHFHVLAYLPEEEELEEKEVVRRYGVLKGALVANMLANELAKKHAQNDEKGVEETLAKIKKRMYDVGIFMKILKQWFTTEYNRRYAHAGTLWESAYRDRVVKMATKDLSDALCYIHLNPIRAAICEGFDEYWWSSLHAVSCGDETAIKGMRQIYGEALTMDEMRMVHENRMRELLEEEKRKRAEDIARKRAAGYAMATDPLTDEAMVAQAAAHIKKVITASLELKAVERSRRESQRAELEGKIAKALAENPELTMSALAEIVGVDKSTISRHLKRKKLQHKV